LLEKSQLGYRQARKVLGASVLNILALLAIGFIRFMTIAVALSVPLVRWGLNQWMNQYAFRIELGPRLFILPIAMIFVIAFVTIVLRSIKVAIANPVESLRRMS
jgi:putative ABC transport system permease protein